MNAEVAYSIAIAMPSDLEKAIKFLEAMYQVATDDDLCESLSNAIENLKDARDRLAAIDQEEADAEPCSREDYAYDQWRDDQLTGHAV